jgi:hypothetical protein
MPGRPRASNRGLSKNRTSGQEIEVEAMEEGEINNEAGQEVVMEDMDYTELKNKFVKPEKRVAGETGPKLSSEEELMAQFSTVGNEGTNNGKEDVRECFKSNRNGKFNDLCFKPLLSNG